MSDTDNPSRAGARRRRYAAIAILASIALPAAAQNPQTTRQRPPRNAPITDTARAHELYVSKDPKDLPGCGDRCAAEIADKRHSDSVYSARSRGVMDFQKVTYKSRSDGLEIPAYVFAPLDKSGAKHPALVWVH